MDDYLIIGSGIVGLSTAYEIKCRYPRAKITVIDKEKGPAAHQSGHNSGVIHAGIYYQPGSLKSILCRSGLNKTKNFCKDNGIKYNQCGKLIVATCAEELEPLAELYRRGSGNDLSLEMIRKADLGLVESNVSGLEAILCKDTAIVDYKRICRTLVDRLKQGGVSVIYESDCIGIDESDRCVTVSTSNAKFNALQVVTCGGLQADRLAKLSGIEINFKIIPFRGEYYKLRHSQQTHFNHLIYPVPDAKLPFLGVHVTKMIDGSTTVGPNAVLGMSREGYEKFSFDLKDFYDYMKFPGFWKLLYKYKRQTIKEFRSAASKKYYLKLCQKYAPGLRINDLEPYRSGIRAQAVSSDGNLIHDFQFASTSRVLHVCNAPSPAATSALAIAEYIVNKLNENDNS